MVQSTSATVPTLDKYAPQLPGSTGGVEEPVKEGSPDDATLAPQSNTSSNPVKAHSRKEVDAEEPSQMADDDSAILTGWKLAAAMISAMLSVFLIALE